MPSTRINWKARIDVASGVMIALFLHTDWALPIIKKPTLSCVRNQHYVNKFVPPANAKCHSSIRHGCVKVVATWHARNARIKYVTWLSESNMVAYVAEL